MDRKQTIKKMGRRVYLLNEFDHVVSSFFNLSVSLKNIFVPKREIKRNQSLIKGIHDICFVIGNGPSLTEMDLKIAQAYPTFTVNFFHKGFRDFSSDYHICIDHGFISEVYAKEYVIDIYNKHKQTKFIFNIQMEDVMKQKNCVMDRAYFIRPYYIQCGDNIRIDMSKVMTGSINVIPVAIECALYMGYKHIYLLGCDMNLLSNHFYDNRIYRPQKERGSGLRATSYAFFHHYALDNLARQMGREIVNLTQGSLLDAYRMDTIENAFPK